LPVEQTGETYRPEPNCPDIELDDASSSPPPNTRLTTIVENGEQLEIVRDNMPFGDAGNGEFGTLFHRLSKSPHRIEQMLVNMFRWFGHRATMIGLLGLQPRL